MNAIHLRRLLAAALLAALSAAAVAGHHVARPDPLDAGATVPPVRHESAFARYRLPVEAPVAPWKASNDTVGRIGGWRAYTREAQPPAAPASSPAPAAHHAH